MTDHTIHTLDSLTVKFHNDREKDYKLHKENIRCRLTGNNKYYYANHCYTFGEHIKANGWKNVLPQEINYVYFDTHSITIKLKSTAETDIKRFESAKEMFAYVVGFNDCLFDIEQYGTPTQIHTI